MVNNSYRIYVQDDLGLSREILNRKVPIFSQIFIWIFLALFISGLLYIAFAPMEEVVRAQGVIRPTINVSTLRNIISGQVIEKKFSPGDSVVQGQLLLQIESSIQAAQLTALTQRKRELSLQFEGAEMLLLAFPSGTLEGNAPRAIRARFDAYIAEVRRLNHEVSVANRLLEVEKRLPRSGTTPFYLRELEDQSIRNKLALERYQKDFLRGLYLERNALSVQKLEVESQIIQINTALRNAQINAPVSGFVQEISSINVGDYLQVDQPILRIVPSTEEALRVELRVPSRQIGKIRVGMEVNLRFPTLPFHDFGGAKGVIYSLDPDATNPNQGEPFFLVLSTIDKDFLTNKNGDSYPIKIGYGIDARIVLKNRTILQMFLDIMDLWV